MDPDGMVIGRHQAGAMSSVAAGGFRSSWDGRDDQGTQLRGVFFARMTSDGRALETRKVVLE